MRSIVRGRDDRDDAMVELHLREPKGVDLSVDNLLITQPRGNATPYISESYLNLRRSDPSSRRFLSSGNQMLWQKLDSVEIDHIDIGRIHIDLRYARVV